MRTVLAATATFSLIAVALGLLAASQGGTATSGPGTRPPAAAASPSPASSATPRPAATGATRPAAPAVAPVEIAARPDTVPAPIRRSSAATVTVDLETTEVIGTLADGSTYAYWTFGGTVPGPMIRVRVGDTVELKLKNAPNSAWPHSIDLHAVTGPGGGAGASQTAPGKDTAFRFKALNPGIYVYHCATAPIPMHVASGMYGLILVEPEGGLPAVDREFYVVQGELYTNAAAGAKGHHTYLNDKAVNERPDYVVFNGRPGALTGEGALKAKVGETIRIYVGVGGFLPSSFHVIGEIFDRVYVEGSIGSEPLRNIQTTLVPAGGAAIVEMKLEVPGRYLLVDHVLPRVFDKGAVGFLDVEGPEAPDVFSGGAGGGH